MIVATTIVLLNPALGITLFAAFPDGVLFVVVFPGVVFPGVVFPGVVFPGVVFPGVVFPDVVFPGSFVLSFETNFSLFSFCLTLSV